ncbi:WXG100 family type VII secretion target [Microbacterium sp. cx-55]|uniref:WXG100 family type VII secretion target n=1 Tax=unclassified Microbacterium TaxID=2609290 RepID=UPI001CBBFB66|nr:MULTISPECIES: WXG100 family type VII secretion target [unclassified Microbacterium]MBZ4485935.1 WXG100 family type VII secretion target [Microbacterium sp. cx-55]MCC4906896.1 WXG100 family type VII secretion target [Microbacterium sp. cx-59]UGB34190.1 WXG100 family type VII secretion target [Microbacterium sp. cx-55]
MTISFDDGRHEAFVHALGAAVAAMQTYLEELEQEVTGLRADWDGAASAAYGEAQGKWSAAMKELSAAIKRARDGASSAGALLVSAETTVRDLWSE